MTITALHSTLIALLVCSVIGGVAVMLALPGAWLLARWRARKSGWFVLVAALLALPLLLPSYLAYAGYSIVRSPGTLLGDALARLPPDLNVLANQITAAIGLAMWLYPLAAVALTLGFSKIPQEALDALRLAGARGMTCCKHVLLMSKSAILTAWALTSIVLLGSAVPLHLARIDTPAIDAWARLSLGQVGQAHAAMIPVLLIVAGAGLIMALSRRAGRRSGRGADGDFGATPSGMLGGRSTRSVAGRLPAVGAAVVWCLAVVLPMVLLATGLPSLHASVTHIELAWPSIVASMGLCAAAGVLAGGLCAGSMLARASGKPAARVAAVVHWALLATMLVPGVFVGSWLRWAWSLLPVGAVSDWLDTSGALLVIAYVLRFGAVATWLGNQLVASQEPSLRDIGTLTGGGIGGIWRTLGLRYWPVFPAVAVACGLLSLYEIEAMVMLQPAGIRPLSQRLLELLHYNRDEELSVLGLLIAAVGLAGAGIVGLLAALVAKRGHQPPTATASREV